uniref:LRP chaperone MESD-like n=1 Tax=Styela clava TaxID=7725 RepID=UPI00193ACD03|nr:LRP chaperone MESD-like [Styela clava]
MRITVDFLFVCSLLLHCILCTTSAKEAKKEAKKKDPRDYTDADIYKLEEEWTEDGDIDEGDLPEHLRKAEPVDFSKLNTEDPESVIKMTKRHKTLMMFATVSGDPSQDETEDITTLWQNSLYNANIEITRFVISPNRILIKLVDGSYAYEIKDFLVQQERCESVTIEGKTYPGKGSPDYKQEKPKKDKKSEKKKEKSKDEKKQKKKKGEKSKKESKKMNKEEL